MNTVHGSVVVFGAIPPPPAPLPPPPPPPLPLCRVFTII